MITIILEKGDKEIARSSLEGNQQYLIRDESSFTLLSELSECDYDVFGQSDMPALLDELETIQQSLEGEERSHINDIINLAIRCRDEEGLIISFTPFD